MTSNELTFSQKLLIFLFPKGQDVEILCAYERRLMVETLLLFGVEKLWDLLVRESGRFQGVEDQINELKRDLNMLKCFVEDADAKKHTIAMVRSCIKEIKEIVYDAEDIIETFLWREEYGKTNGFRNRVRRLSCGIVEQKRLVWDIEAISKRISNVIRNMQSLGVQQVIVNDMHMQIQQEKQREIRKTFSNENESILVGLEENIAKLVSYLVMEDSSQVVSVTGMGGIGKTTLARQVFNHETIKNRFNGLAWVCVSQQFSRKYVWQTILRKLQNDYIEPEISEDELQEKLFHVLETQKALIVLDDIWKEEDWDRIKQIFPQKTGWKVLLTSRNEGVALRADPTCFTFKPDCLTLEESWSVFRRIAFPKENTLECKVDEEMEQMGKQMIKQCGGLPLAVRVLGGLLAAKYTLQDWKRVCENLGSHLMGRSNFNDENNDSLNYVLSLSFEELPSYLKHCFLYLAHFPEDYQINVGKLSHYWAAEGILNPMCENGEVVRDVGHCYIEELVKRNMVISERDFRTSKFETCHLHDMMREICLFKAKEENFIQDDDLRSTTPRSQSRRFVSQYPKTLNVERDINSRKLRSLLIVLDDSGKSCTLNGLSFTMLRLLRVLDLSSTRLQGRKLPSSIGKLIHLRYLSLEFAMVFHLPSSLQNLKLLIYLNLDVAARSIFVPNILMGMKDLRYLALPEYMDENTKLELRNQVKLESLINFSTKNITLEDINGMKRLRTLTISLTEEASLETLFASMTELSSLETLVISSTSYRDHGFVGRIKNGLFLNMIHLKYLSLRRIYMTRLPHEQFLPTHLTCLDLCECRLKEDPMPILEKLLHLTDVNLLNKAFCGKVIVCSSGGFPLLKKISFVGLNEWEEWIVEEGSMPLLHTLKIQNCKGLKELPHGLPFLYSLRDLSVHLMGEKWEEKLWKEGEDYYKVQHIPFVTFG